MNFYRELNQIYCNNKFDTPEDILTLESYFFDQDKVSSFSLPVISLSSVSCNKEPESPTQNKSKDCCVLPSISTRKDNQPSQEVVAAAAAATTTIQAPRNTTTEWFEPVQSDTVFWCVYTFVKGYSDYLMIGSRYANHELEEKQKLFAFFKKCPKVLKTTNCKITNAQVDEILSEMLCMQDQMSFLGILALVVYYKINILLVHETKKIYLSFCLIDDDTEESSNVSKKTCVLYKHPKSNKRYKMRMYDEELETISNIKETMLCLESYMKPLRAISTYKVSELEEIADKLGIEVSKMKKQELYTKIQEYCVWQ
jgi:hypothetical protein